MSLIKIIILVLDMLRLQSIYRDKVIIWNNRMSSPENMKHSIRDLSIFFMREKEDLLYNKILTLDIQLDFRGIRVFRLEEYIKTL